MAAMTAVAAPVSRVWTMSWLTIFLVREKLVDFLARISYTLVNRKITSIIFSQPTIATMETAIIKSHTKLAINHVYAAI